MAKSLLTFFQCSGIVCLMLNFRYPDKPTDTAPQFFNKSATMKPEQWIVQRKYDGWHMPVFIDGANSVRLLTREGKLMQQAYRGVLPAELPHLFLSLGLPDGTVLGTELVGPRGGHSVQVFVFDMYAWAGEWLVSEGFQTRWQRCLDFVGPKLDSKSIIHLAETIYPKADDVENAILTEFDKLKTEWITQGERLEYLYEGLVAKRRTGTLTMSQKSSNASAHCFKIKFRDIKSRRY